MNANACMMICPNGTYGNPSNYSCIPCPYFTYLGKCLLTCPNETNVGISSGKAICENCSITDNTCQDKYKFILKTTVSDDGQSLIHKVHLPKGLSS